MRGVAFHTRLGIVISTAALGALFALLNQLIEPATVLARGGGLDRYGCHRDNKAGNYHCHRGPCAGKTFGSQAEMLKAACSI